MKNDYDVYFRIRGSMPLAVCAHSKKEAKELALKYLQEMSRNELLEKFAFMLEWSDEFVIEYVDLIERNTGEEE